MNALTDVFSHGVYGLKPRFQQLLRPVARKLATFGVRANQVTIATVLASAAVGCVVTTNVHRPIIFLLLPTFFFLRMALNALDGILARDFGQQTTVGVYLNELGDILADLCCYMPFAFLPGVAWWGIVAVVIMAIVTESAGLVGPMAHATRRYDGPMGKSDRAAVFGVLALWIGTGGTISHPAALVFSSVMVLLLTITVVNRIRHGLQEAEAISAPAVQTGPESHRYFQQRFFETHDGTRLFYRYWPATGGKSNRAIVLLHRGHEHSGRMAHLADELNLPEYSVFAWDARGHGHSTVANDKEPTLGTFVKDLDRFVAHISHAYGIAMEDIALVTQSVGSVVAATWVHDYAPPIRSLVLAAPAFRVKLYIPFSRTALRWMHRIFGDFHVKSYVRPHVLTHDRERIASYQSDPFITRPISVRVLLGLYGTSERVVRDAHAILVPTQLLLSPQDWVVHNRPQLEFFDRLGTATKEKHVFKGFYHDILGEKNRSIAIEKVRAFVTRAFAAQPAIPDLRDSDRRGKTKEKFDALQAPAPLHKRAGFAVLRSGVKLGARFSNGMRVGRETGFDSGASLDYVYRNRASGLPPLGSLLDRMYLNSPGWRGIRARKENMILALRCALVNLREKGMPIRVLDVAAGQGRYVLDAIAGQQHLIDDVLLRDYSELNVQLGRELIRERQIGDLVRFEQGDAFNSQSFADLRFSRTLGVVSGLYELFPENPAVRTSLALLGQTVVPGGYLAYTCQPFHPQLELIARTLPNREGRPWIMRCRTQAEMDQLAGDAGFHKIEQWIDDEGMFSVSLAQRIG